MADLHIPEDVEKSFEELWQEHRFEIEQAEAKAIYDPSMSDDTPIIKVIKSIFIFACPCLEQIESCSIIEHREHTLTWVKTFQAQLPTRELNGRPRSMPIKRRR